MTRMVGGEAVQAANWLCDVFCTLAPFASHNVLLIYAGDVTDYKELTGGNNILKTFEVRSLFIISPCPITEEMKIRLPENQRSLIRADTNNPEQQSVIAKAQTTFLK